MVMMTGDGVGGDSVPETADGDDGVDNDERTMMKERWLERKVGEREL